MITLTYLLIKSSQQKHDKHVSTHSFEGSTALVHCSLQCSPQSLPVQCSSSENGSFVKSVLFLVGKWHVVKNQRQKPSNLHNWNHGNHKDATQTNRCYLLSININQFQDPSRVKPNLVHGNDWTVTPSGMEPIRCRFHPPHPLKHIVEITCVA